MGRVHGIYLRTYYLNLTARCIFIVRFVLFFMFSALFWGRFFMAQSAVTMNYVEITWTLTPFFFVLAVLVPMFFSISFFESYSFLWNSLGFRRQWYWGFQNFLASRDLYFLRFNITSFFESFNSPLAFFGVTSEDVIHDIGIPSLNMKMDACPGRINSSLGFNHTRRLHYRTCSELCRVNHSYIPLQII